MLFKLGNNKTIRVIEIRRDGVEGILNKRETMNVSVRKNGMYTSKERKYTSSRREYFTYAEVIQDFDLTPLDKEFTYKTAWEKTRWGNFSISAGDSGWYCQWDAYEQKFITPRDMKAVDKVDLKRQFSYMKFIEQSCLDSYEVNDFRRRVNLETWEKDFKGTKAGRDAHSRACNYNNYLTDDEAYSLFYRM